MSHRVAAGIELQGLAMAAAGLGDDDRALRPGGAAEAQLSEHRVAIGGLWAGGTRTAVILRLMPTGEGTTVGGVTDPAAAAGSDGSLIELVREARPHLARAGPETEAWLTRLEEQHDALHDLAEQLLVADPQTALEVAATLWPFWWQRGHMKEGRELLERAATIDGADRRHVLKGVGTIAFRQGDTEVAERAFLERLELVEGEGMRREFVDALTDLSRIALRRGDFVGVRRYAERAYAAAEGLDREAIRLPLHMRAAAARMEGQLDEARALYLENRELNESLGNDMNVAVEDHNLVHVALRSGDRDEAGRRFRASSAWIFANDNAYLRPYAFLDAGILALDDGDLERAGRLVACAQRIFEDTDAIPDPDDRVELDEAVARLRQQLGERFDAVWAEGRALSRDEAQTLAEA
jgi:tetratricopeptide (TPR) repeat protein